MSMPKIECPTIDKCKKQGALFFLCTMYTKQSTSSIAQRNPQENTSLTL